MRDRYPTSSRCVGVNTQSEGLAGPDPSCWPARATTWKQLAAASSRTGQARASLAPPRPVSGRMVLRPSPWRATISVLHPDLKAPVETTSQSRSPRCSQRRAAPERVQLEIDRPGPAAVACARRALQLPAAASIFHPSPASAYTAVRGSWASRSRRPRTHHHARRPLRPRFGRSAHRSLPAQSAASATT